MWGLCLQVCALVHLIWVGLENKPMGGVRGGSCREELAGPSGMWTFEPEPSWVVEVSSLAGPSCVVPEHL